MVRSIVDIAKTHTADINTHLVGEFNCFLDRKRGLFPLCKSCLFKFICITGHPSDAIRQLRDDLIQEAHHKHSYKEIE